MITNMRIVSGQTYQVVDETEDDEQARECSQNEHDLSFFDAILAECFDLEFFTNFHVFVACAIGEQEIYE